MVRIDYAPKGIDPPHTHPRATEILTILEGSLEIGFVTSNPDNRLISKILQKSDVLFSQSTSSTSNVTWAMPDISTDVLAKAIQLDKNIVANIQSKIQRGNKTLHNYL
ncbi:hypothetical protein ACSBR1_014463 [Camellia fascicularis]